MTQKWYALAVQPRKEQYVQSQLSAQGYTVSCPRYRKVVRHARQTKTVLAPLFPGYLFVQIDLTVQNWRKANWIPGSIGLVKFDNRPAALNGAFIDTFITGNREDGLVNFKDNLKVGDRVRAIGGPLDNLVGEVVAMADQDRVKVLMEALNRKIHLTLPRSDVVVAA